MINVDEQIHKTILKRLVRSYYTFITQLFTCTGTGLGKICPNSEKNNYVTIHVISN